MICHSPWPGLTPERVASSLPLSVRLTPERFRMLIEEGARLSRQFDRDTAGMRILTAEDRAQVSR